MSQRYALLDYRHRPGPGLTTTLLMLLATMLGIVLVGLATVSG